MSPVRARDPSRIQPAPQPDVPEAVGRAAATFFGALSRVRRKRIFHPRGDGFEAAVEVDRPLHRFDGIPLLAERATHGAVVRLSRAVGLPAPLPDLLGLALRLEDLYGSGAHQDFLLISSARPPLLRHLLVPARGGFAQQSYSSILPYRAGVDLLLVGALPAGPLEYDLAVAPLRGNWAPFARLRLRAALSHERTEALRFNPWNTGPGLEPVGPMNGLRRSSYAGSQRGRSATGREEAAE